MPHLHHASVESLWISVALAFVALVYLHRWLRVGWLPPKGIKGWRAGSFFVGLLLMWVGLGSPLALLDHQLLTAHMAQHLLFMTLAPPLIFLGKPWRLVPQLVQPHRFYSIPMVHLVGMLSYPVVGWIGATAILVLWHVPAVFALGMRSELWHGIEQASFLVTGLLFWWPVMESSRNASKWPESSIILYLFLATLPCDILSGFLVFCDRVVYPFYLSSEPRFGLTALEDQQCAGALMWTCVTVVYLIAGSVFAARLVSPRWSRDYSISPSVSQPMAVANNQERRMEIA
jgi:cytochrome c oxidase assembly factor CtaG